MLWATADAAAKEGVEAHVRLPRHEGQALHRYIKDLERIALTIAATCRLWPSSREFSGQLSRRPCVAQAPVPGAPPPAEQSLHGRQHCLRWYSHGSDVIAVCTNCGSWWGQARAFAAPCRTPDNPYSAEAKRRKRTLDSFLRDEHPVEHTVLARL